jgi:PAS domain S-box-containing protein
MFRALLVCSDHRSLEIVQRVCQDRGNDFSSRSTVRDAQVGLDDRDDYDLLILDWTLPESREFCDRLSSHPRRAEICLLLLVESEARQDVERVLAAGADDYVIKPLDSTHLKLRLAVAERGWERRRAQQRACESYRETAEQLTLAATGAHDGFWYVKVKVEDWFQPSAPVWYSPQMKALMGFADHELDNVLESWSSRLHPDDEARVFQALEDHLLRRAAYDVEYRLQVRSGEYRWFRGRGQAQWDEAGRATRFAGSVRDVTDQHHFDEALRESESRHRLAAETLRKERALLQQLVDVHERERQLFAYEIHDGLVQHLAASLMHLEVFNESKDGPSDLMWYELARGLKLLRSAVSEGRRLISGLRPPILDEYGIVAAIEYLINEHREALPEVVFNHETRFARLPPPLENAVFRVVQEALANVRRHSGCQRAQVQLLQLADRLRVEVTDWGIGFHPEHVAQDRFGLQGMRERARLLGGQATIDSAPGRGTRVSVEFPLLPQ